VNRDFSILRRIQMSKRKLFRALDENLLVRLRLGALKHEETSSFLASMNLPFSYDNKDMQNVLWYIISNLPVLEAFSKDEGQIRSTPLYHINPRPSQPPLSIFRHYLFLSPPPHVHLFLFSGHSLNMEKSLFTELSRIIYESPRS